jgi:hypothetical protein
MADKNAPRIAKLESRVGVPHEVQDFIDRVQSSDKVTSTASSQALEKFDVLSSDAVAAAQVTDVIFDIDDATTATLVRLRLSSGPPHIVTSSKHHGVLSGQVVGRFIEVLIEAEGDADQVAIVKVQHAVSDTIQLKLADGKSGLKSLFVTG